MGVLAGKAAGRTCVGFTQPVSGGRCFGEQVGVWSLSPWIPLPGCRERGQAAIPSQTTVPSSSWSPEAQCWVLAAPKGGAEIGSFGSYSLSGL